MNFCLSNNISHKKKKKENCTVLRSQQTDNDGKIIPGTGKMRSKMRTKKKFFFMKEKQCKTFFEVEQSLRRKLLSKQKKKKIQGAKYKTLEEEE